MEFSGLCCKKYGEYETKMLMEKHALSVMPGDFFVGNGMHHLDNAVNWSKQQGLRLSLDLHGVPGQQSG